MKLDKLVIFMQCILYSCKATLHMIHNLLTSLPERSGEGCPGVGSKMQISSTTHIPMCM